MCSTCGKRGMRYVMFPHGKHVAWCSDTGKSCRVSARHCEGAFIREDKIKKTLKEWEMLYGPEGVDYEQK
jgi:hypothetical protein